MLLHSNRSSNAADAGSSHPSLSIHRRCAGWHTSFANWDGPSQNEPVNPNPKIITPKGSRYPGSGRPKGKPNRISVEVKQLVSQLMTDINYQFKLREDFCKRRVHPTIEALIWQYHLGRPRQDLTVTATVDVTARLEEERRVFATLEVHELEQLAAESQALVDRALALSRARVGTLTPQDVVGEAEPVEEPTESLRKTLGSDKDSSVTYGGAGEEMRDPPIDTGPNSEIP
jgi:hypothetical protein